MTGILAFFDRTRKAWIALLSGGGISAFLIEMTTLTPEIVAAIIGLLTGFLTWIVPNRPPVEVEAAIKRDDKATVVKATEDAAAIKRDDKVQAAKK